MRQAILLDSTDLTTLREGKPLTIHMGESAIEIMYRSNSVSDGKTWQCPECNKVMAIVSKGGHAKWHKKNDKMWTCPICDFKCNGQGRGPHMLTHKKGGKK